MVDPWLTPTLLKHLYAAFREEVVGHRRLVEYASHNGSHPCVILVSAPSRIRRIGFQGPFNPYFWSAAPWKPIRRLRIIATCDGIFRHTSRPI